MSSSDASERRRSRHERKASRVRPGRAGFTLIEVLAAVALLGILYSVLARVAIEGLRAEGDSKRRLEASLLADERLYDLYYTAPMPPIGHSEQTEGDFTFAIDVTPFALPPEWSVGESENATPLLLAVAPDGGVQALRTVQITVSWLEGASERHVSRNTYMLDYNRVAALTAASASPPNPEPTGEEPAQDQDLPTPTAPDAP